MNNEAVLPFLPFPRALLFHSSLETYLRSVYQEKFSLLQSSLVTPPRPYTLRVNTALTSAEKLIGILKQEGIIAKQIPLVPDAIEIPYTYEPKPLTMIPRW